MKTEALEVCRSALRGLFGNLGRRYLFVLFALCAAGSASFAQTSADFFDDSQVQDVYLTVSSSDWATLKEHYLEDTYYHATFRWRDFSLPLGIKSRGSGSRSPEKPNLDLNFAKYDKKQSFLGFTKVTMKANNQDASMLRDRLAMRLFRTMGFPAPREAPARLFINGEYFGFYCLVESVDESFLALNYAESGGYLYKWNAAQEYHFEYLGEDPALYSPLLWEPKTHESDPDPAPIVDLVRTINQASDASFEAEVSRFLNLKLFLSYLAVEVFLAEVDGVLGDSLGMNNFYVYRLQSNGTSEFIPWDKDLTLIDSERHITQGMDVNVLTRRAIAVPELREAYLSALSHTATVAGGPDGWLAQEVERDYAQIREVARNDPHKQKTVDGVVVPASADDFEREANWVRRFVRGRTAFVLNEVSQAGYVPAAGLPSVVAIGNAASSDSAVLARGGLVRISGQDFGHATARADSDPLPNVLEGISVSVNGVRAPLLFVSPNLINIQVPWEAAAGEGTVAVNVDGRLSQPVAVQIGGYSPGIFLLAHASDWAAVNEENPASSGETLMIFATGLGPVDPPVPTGHAPPEGMPSSSVDLPVVSVDGVPAQVASSQLVPGAVGFYAITVRLPAEVASRSTAKLTLTAGGESATTNIAIR